eukprot:c22616_g1_i2 orf=317-922(-)
MIDSISTLSLMFSGLVGSSPISPLVAAFFLFRHRLRSPRSILHHRVLLASCSRFHLGSSGSLSQSGFLTKHRRGNCLSPTGVRSQSQGMAGNSELVPTIVVYVTVPNKDTGRNLAKSIINAKLAACVNQVPGIESTYWWQGKVEIDSEELLIIKTRQSLLEALIEHVKANHPYEVPEVIALPIVGGNPAYLKWLEESTQTL